MVELRIPDADLLPDYESALNRGWSPTPVAPEVTRQRHLAAIAQDRAAFLASLDDRAARGAPVILPDGSTVPRLPGFSRWVWHGGFCGVVNMRWQPGTADLPAHVLGHVGYGIVPWRRREGIATSALGLLLAAIAPIGLPFVELTTDPANDASIRVITANGGVLVERFTKVAAHGGGEALRWRITL
ncbi:GNAT family N-acetyltransferase [Falsiroseomonas stagni]|uniref:Predicted acetyltransferase n=1 Tax=Falsiroseomonas stagni DSM 19981 TaxID=1123062 RepID=A0A1I4DD46_9PROT|nr:GNAT family N-acetyltransferase [Falsiroseomonas stagni]SFK90700.1 Predicted acetyltransferase [Falsiroseomonas stagni DSM 19981]